MSRREVGELSYFERAFWVLVTIVVFFVLVIFLPPSSLTFRPAESGPTLEQRVDALERRMGMYHINQKPADGDIETIVKFRRKLDELEARIQALE